MGKKMRVVRTIGDTHLELIFRQPDAVSHRTLLWWRGKTCPSMGQKRYFF